MIPLKLCWWEAPLVIGVLYLFELLLAVTDSGRVVSSDMWWILIVRVLELFIIWCYWCLMDHSMQELGLSGRQIVQGLVLAIKTCLVCGLLVGAAELLGRTLADMSPVSTAIPILPREPAAVLLTTVIAGPLLEELVFRVLVYNFFRRFLPVSLALVPSVALFAFSHPVEGLYYIIPAVGGVLFCLLYEKSRSLVAPFSVHAVANLFIYGLALCL